MPDDDWLDPLQQRVWRAGLAAARLLAEAIDGQLRRDAGLTHADYELLVHLSEAPTGRLRMGDLASRTLFSRSRLSHAVSRMEAQGLVARAGCGSDRRGTYAQLTPAGYAQLAAAAPGHARTVRATVFAGLSRSQLIELDAILASIRDHLAVPEECPGSSGGAPGSAAPPQRPAPLTARGSSGSPPRGRARRRR